MPKVFEVFYLTSCDHSGHEHSSSKTIDAESEEEAEQKVLYNLGKDYPQAVNSIEKTKDITWAYKK